ncbi:nucleoside diphosphate kinase regulator [Altererythrobacter sp. C41]|uniref:nucleoside diphosphate kinase regulator n=1 Tax=Altererythrobacter sp. C41 TaxID=2806021 RepID=UPI0019346F1A|nr:nucleoside diphosphate kinase regulator [Altererythrobacter sp. C41]MBM0169964.1 nucleoside diphosphate kinase regulator [Altererythrobacter sp. C41]
MTPEQAAQRPPITLIESEADTLADLAFGIRARHPNVSRLLLEEIDRADTLSAEDMPGDVVTMGSTVEFAVQKTGERRTVKLVYPKDADIAEGRLSILTPVGAGLIGLRIGQSISWPDRNGEERLLTIENVTQPD